MQCPGCNTTLSTAARFCGSCGMALTVGGSIDAAGRAAAVAPAPSSSEPTTDMIGREIAGRYRIRAMLGAGGMGAVFRAEQLSLKRTVALKLLKEELCEEPGIVARFNAEAELAAKLNHPNTVTLFDFGQDRDGALFIAMEYVQGTSLRVELRNGPLALDRAIAIAEQVAASLADAHTYGIVHRDLKPDNVMLSQRGKRTDIVTVLDFGIAKLRDRDESSVTPVTQAGDLLGTPQYMAPEQIRGDAVDGRTDVYALGVMLYEMVTGQVPFTGKTVMAILSRQLTEPPPAPSTLRPELAARPELEALIMAALQKAPEQRPPSMDAMGDRLAELSSVATPARSDPPSTPRSAPPSSGLGAGASRRPVMRSVEIGPTLRPPLPAGIPNTVPPTGGPIRPPGVPLTQESFPHPMPQPPVAQASPAQSLVSVGHAPTAAAGTSHGVASAPVSPSMAAPLPPAQPAALQPAPPLATRSLVLWVAGGLAICALITAGIVLGTRGGKDGETRTVANASAKSDQRDDSEEPSSAEPKTNPKTLSGTAFRHAGFGYRLRIPPSFVIQRDGADGLWLNGTHDHIPVTIGVGCARNDNGWNDSTLIDNGMKLARVFGGLQTLRYEFRMIDGKRRLVGTFVSGVGQRVTFVSYAEGKLGCTVGLGAPAHAFNGVLPLATELFERRFQMP